jgi:hypothetical protein
MKLLRAVAAVVVFRLARWCAEMGDRIIVKPGQTGTTR